jgi:hypothetical protein
LFTPFVVVEVIIAELQKAGVAKCAIYEVFSIEATYKGTCARLA